MSQNVIELNGKRYDAITGAFLGSSPKAAVAAIHRPLPGKAIDGFIRRAPTKPRPPQHVAAKLAPTAMAKPKSLDPIKSTMHKAVQKPRVEAPTATLHHAGHAHVHKPAKPAGRHQPERAKTLMRRAVHKPAVTLKPAIKPQAPAELAARPASAVLRKGSAEQVDPGRLERAKSAAKHGAVRRFQRSKTGQEPVASAVHTPVDRVPVIAVRPQPAASVPVRSRQPAQYPDIFEAAIKRAKSHEQPQHKRHARRRPLAGILAGIAVFFILGGFITYLNMPNIQLHVASVEAGFKASMPSHRPVGYALRGGVQHSGGTVSMRFISGDSSFQITEQSSNWDSQALLDNTLALAGPHQTIERNGRTVYVYGDGANAAWVTGNIRYDITGNASLSATELADIAASM